MHLINPKLSLRQKQIIIGTILGGSSIVHPSKGKNCYLSMRSKNARWLEYKALHLQTLTSPKPFTIEVTNRWHSMCYPLFNEFKDMFYEDGKRKLTIDTLENLLLTDIAFSIWYGESGKYNKGKITLNTHIWGEDGTKAIVKYFKYLDWRTEIVLERKRYRIRLDEKSSDDFLKIVSPQLPHWFHRPPTGQ